MSLLSSMDLNILIIMNKDRARRKNDTGLPAVPRWTRKRIC